MQRWELWERTPSSRPSVPTCRLCWPMLLHGSWLLRRPVFLEASEKVSLLSFACLTFRCLSRDSLQRRMRMRPRKEESSLILMAEKKCAVRPMLIVRSIIASFIELRAIITGSNFGYLFTEGFYLQPQPTPPWYRVQTFLGATVMGASFHMATAYTARRCDPTSRPLLGANYRRCADTRALGQETPCLARDSDGVWRSGRVVDCDDDGSLCVQRSGQRAVRLP